MLWWLIALTVVVLYLLWRVQQLVAGLTALSAWEKTFYQAVIAQFKACGCPSDPTWPPPEPPSFP